MYIAMRVEDYSYCLWFRPLFTADVPHACAAGEMDACVASLQRIYEPLHCKNKQSHGLLIDTN